MALRQLTSRLAPRLLVGASSRSAIAGSRLSSSLLSSPPSPAVAQAASSASSAFAHDGRTTRIHCWQPAFARGNSSVAPQQELASKAEETQTDEALTALKAAAEALAPPDLEAPMTVPILNFQREEVGRIALPADIFKEDIRRDILQRVVRWQLAKRQQGTHSVKSRGMVRGGGRKPIPQKKTGNARAGSNRSPLWRGGGVIHGPVPRSHAHSLPKKVRRLGLKVALSAKASEGRLFILDTMAVEGKTKAMNQSLDEFLSDAPRRSILFLDSGKEAPDGGAPLRRAISNLPWVDALPQEGANVYSILQRDYLAMTPGALYSLVARLRTPIRR